MELHKKQRELLQLLSDNIDNPLTIRELQEELALSSPSLVAHHIKQLEKKKYLKRNPNNPKDYQILNDPDNLIGYVNMYGLARCGEDGTLLSGDPIDRIPLSPKVIHFNIEDAFIVKAVGDSMYPKIHEGDLVIAKTQNTADNAEIVICTLDGKAMIKKVFLQEKILVSINSEIPPIPISEDAIFKIEGIVKSVICSH